MPSLIPSAREAAKLLGGDAIGASVLGPGPGHSRADRSLSVRFDDNAPDGFVVHSFAGNDPLLCRDYVRERLGLPLRDFRKRIPSRLLPRRSQQASGGQAGRIRVALDIWQAARSIRGTPAEVYLTSRGLRVDEALTHVLRFSVSLKLDGKVARGMVALYRDAITNEPCGCHRTYLHQDGRPVLDAKGDKIRKMLGRAKGAAIKLDAQEEVVAGLHLGEGIETCLAARQLGYRPTWAVGSAGEIERFPVLPGIEAITVFTENDIASAKAADIVCARYEDADCEAMISAPPDGDWADTLNLRGRP
jgi:putative DNA primase/helicase